MLLNLITLLSKHAMKPVSLEFGPKMYFKLYPLWIQYMAVNNLTKQENMGIISVIFAVKR